MQLQIILATLLASGSLAAPRPNPILETGPGSVPCNEAQRKASGCTKAERCYFHNDGHWVSCAPPNANIERRATTGNKNTKVPPGAIACNHVERNEAKCSSDELCVSFDEGNQTQCIPLFLGRRATTDNKDIKVPPGAVACNHVELNEANCSSDERCVSFDEGNETKCIPKATDGQGTGGPCAATPVERRATTDNKDIKVPPGAVACNHVELNEAKCSSDERCVSFDEGNETKCVPKATDGQGTGGPSIPETCPGVPRSSQPCNKTEARKANCPSNAKCLSFDDGHGTFCKPEPAQFTPITTPVPQI